MFEFLIAMIIIVIIFSVLYSHSSVPQGMRLDGKYEGGVKEWIDRVNVWVVTADTGLYVRRFTTNDIERIIPYEKINDISVKTKVEMTSDVTLTRMLVFGVFAFGLKKEKEKEYKFLIVDYTDELERQQNLVISSNYINERFYVEALTKQRESNEKLG